MMKRSRRPKPVFKMDRPFIFGLKTNFEIELNDELVENILGATFFLGRIVNPRN